MFGVPVESPAYVFGDNKSVLSNSSNPHSVLKKKSSSIAYHFVREANSCTKSLPGGEKRTRFTGYFLHYLDLLSF